MQVIPFFPTGFYLSLLVIIYLAQHTDSRTILTHRQIAFLGAIHRLTVPSDPHKLQLINTPVGSLHLEASTAQGNLNARLTDC